MKKILISDTHYGVKNNSVTWLKYQLKFITDQLIPYIKSLNERVSLYHLGDMFDSRSSISPYVAYNVKQAYHELSKYADIYIIGGNHDYYSPKDDEVCSLDMVFAGCDWIHLVTKECLVIEDDLLVPWYKYDDATYLDGIIKDNHIKNIFCHADLPHATPLHHEVFRDCEVYSGHIHTPQRQGNMITLGSTYALTFADCNSVRGFYVLDKTLELHPNTKSIKFWRLYNDDIFDPPKMNNDDYVELYIDQQYLLNDEYVNAIKHITEHIRESNVIPVAHQAEINESVDFNSYDIEKLCKENIPQELMSKFDILLDKMKNE